MGLTAIGTPNLSKLWHHAYRRELVHQNTSRSGSPYLRHSPISRNKSPIGPLVKCEYCGCACPVSIIIRDVPLHLHVHVLAWFVFCLSKLIKYTCIQFIVHVLIIIQLIPSSNRHHWNQPYGNVTKCNKMRHESAPCSKVSFIRASL